MMNIKYMVDSTSDIPHDFAQEHDISVLGMPIIFEDGTSALDWVEMSTDEFYEKLSKSHQIPTTSQPTIPVIEAMMREGLVGHDALIYVTISSKGSGTYQAANLAKQNILEDMPDAKIEVVDSMGYSLYIVAMVQEAMRLQKEGKTLPEIVAGIKAFRCKTDVLVVVDTLKYLEKGGRINKASLIAGTLLDLKPVLAVRGGVMESIDKFRGSKTIISKMVKKIKASDIDLDDPNFCIVNSQVPDRAEQLWAAVKAEFGEERALVMESQIGATVGTHIGPGTLAIFYKLKHPVQVYED